MRLPKLTAELALNKRMLCNDYQGVQSVEHPLLSSQILPAVASRSEKNSCLNELTFDDFVWGSFADHFGKEDFSKCQAKAEQIVKSGKNQHTVFCVDKTIKTELTEYFIEQNKNKWKKDPPIPHRSEYELPPKMTYYHCMQNGRNITCNSGEGFAVVRVQENTETIGEATGNRNCERYSFYSPYHLQRVEN